MTSLSFFVPGIPQPGGSKQAFWNKKNGRGYVVDANKKTKPWQSVIIEHARAAYAGPPLLGPVRVRPIYVFPRPKSHFRTGKFAGELKPGAPFFHNVKPDRGKLTRALEDALTLAGVWRDDCQVAESFETKLYVCLTHPVPGAHVTIETIELETEIFSTAITAAVQTK